MPRPRPGQERRATRVSRAAHGIVTVWASWVSVRVFTCFRPLPVPPRSVVSADTRAGSSRPQGKPPLPDARFGFTVPIASSWPQSPVPAVGATPGQVPRVTEMNETVPAPAAVALADAQDSRRQVTEGPRHSACQGALPEDGSPAKGAGPAASLHDAPGRAVGPSGYRSLRNQVPQGLVT